MAERTAPEREQPVPAEAAQARQRSVRAWQSILVRILLGFVGLLAARLIQTNQSEHRASGEAPPFTVTTFSGETITLASLRGKGVVLNFWASSIALSTLRLAVLKRRSISGTNTESM